MTPRPIPRCVFLFVWLFAALLAPAALHAQVTPAAGYTPPDDTPSIKVGATIFVDYTYNQSPTTKDADGNTIHADAFNADAGVHQHHRQHLAHDCVSYHAGRHARDLRRSHPRSGLSGSQVYRLKYAFAQFNLDDWMTRGSWVRFGLQQTPLVDYMESIYRYRFQGTIVRRARGLPDVVRQRRVVPLQLRQELRRRACRVSTTGMATASRKPTTSRLSRFGARCVRLPTAKPVFRGFRVMGFYDGDNYIKNDEKTRTLFEASYEHKYVNAAFDYLHTTDQPTAVVRDAEGRRLFLLVHAQVDRGSGRTVPLRSLQAEQQLRRSHARSRTIVGVAYWFKHQGTVSTAIMLDWDEANFDKLVPPLPDRPRSPCTVW